MLAFLDSITETMKEEQWSEVDVKSTNLQRLPQDLTQIGHAGGGGGIASLLCPP